jgi:dynein heavy chain 1
MHFPAQVLLLTIQCKWTAAVESSIIKNNLPYLGTMVEDMVSVLAKMVISTLAPIQRRKCEYLLTELVHQRDSIRQLIQQSVTDICNFSWLSKLRFYFEPVLDLVDCLSIKIANTCFFYGFEYLGVQDRLVHTPLTDLCYMTLTQALSNQLGGSPFGPAGIVFSI